MLTVHPHIFKAVLSGLLEEKKSVSDVAGICSAEACRWDEYTTLAVCAAVDDVSSSGEIRVNPKKLPEFRISGTSWVPPSQTLSVADSFWMSAPYTAPLDIRDDTLSPIANIYVAYYPPCNDQKQSRGNYSQWTNQLKDASNWKAYKGTLSLCLQTLKSTFNNTMETIVLQTQKDLHWKAHDKFGTNGTVCLEQPYRGDNFCVGERDLEQRSSSLAQTWEGAASIQADSDNYYTGKWVPNIVDDVIGPNPTVCDPDLGPGYGMEGFTRRINNIAIAMSNA
jgi:hypothetical protein